MQVTQHIYALKIPFKIPMAEGRELDRFVYSFLIVSDRICVVDSGVAGSEKLIFDYIASIGHRPKEIESLILTHSHPDHIGSAAAIKAASGCAVIAHPAEAGWIEDVELQERERPVPGFKALVGGPVTVDHSVNDGDVITSCSGFPLFVLHTPGHSEGSISLFIPDDMALITGDAIPLEGSMPIYDDAKAVADSIRKLRGISCVEVLLSSWDDPRTGDAVYRTMDEGALYLSHIHETVRRLAGGVLNIDPMELCRRVVAELGLPPSAVNPLVARSFMSSLKR